MGVITQEVFPRGACEEEGAKQSFRPKPRKVTSVDSSGSIPHLRCPDSEARELGFTFLSWIGVVGEAGGGGVPGTLTAPRLGGILLRGRCWEQKHT